MRALSFGYGTGIPQVKSTISDYHSPPLVSHLVRLVRGLRNVGKPMIRFPVTAKRAGRKVYAL